LGSSQRSVIQEAACVVGGGLVRTHTLRQFDRDLQTLKDRILLMAGTVEERITESIHAFVSQDLTTSRRLVESDPPVNRLEMQCDELCVRMIVQWQPAASDLRFVVAVLKISTDLERLGDLAVNIAERAVVLAQQPKLSPPVDLTSMAGTVQAMLEGALDAFVRRDTTAAQAILRQDDEVDAAFRDMSIMLVERMKSDPSDVERAVALLFIAKSLERIADHATNIAEDVIFLAEGKDVRHHSSVLPEGTPQ
jgi:phosphate transport system protein